MRKKKKIGVIGLGHGNNIGNNLVKYAMFIKLTELGFDPYIIGNLRKNANISIINKTLKIRIIKNNYTEIKRKDYDFLMVNSDQTWRKRDKKYFYDYAFLQFAKNWNIPKFIYGASLGYNYWTFTKNDEKIAKECLKNFRSISVRENGTIKLIKKHLNISSILVLDPTLLIDKKYYLKIIKNYKNDEYKDNFIFSFLLFGKLRVKKYINKVQKILGYKIYSVSEHSQERIEKFIYGFKYCKAVITDSFHGTLFSIIFNKPFISLVNKFCPKERFLSLRNLLKLEDRILYDYKIPRLSLLTTPLNINYSFLNSLKIKSINYLKKNLGIHNSKI